MGMQTLSREIKMGLANRHTSIQRNNTLFILVMDIGCFGSPSSLGIRLFWVANQKTA